MTVQLVWRHTSRREVELALHVTLRLVHVGGWRHLVVAVERDGHTWCAVELAPDAREDDAHTWAQTFDRRYLVATTISELVAEPLRFAEIYVDGGVGTLLNEVERRFLEKDRLMREARRERR